MTQRIKLIISQNTSVDSYRSIGLDNAVDPVTVCGACRPTVTAARGI